MKPIYGMLASLLFLLIVIACSVFISPIEGLTGTPHPEFPGMKISLQNTDQFAHTRWLGYLFGIGIIGVLISVLFLGNRKKEVVTGMGKWLAIFGVIYTCIYTAMVVSNWSYINSENLDFAFQMPIPTAWMIYGMWFFPLSVTLIYMLRFEEYIISPEEEAELATFLKNHK